MYRGPDRQASTSDVYPGSRGRMRRRTARHRRTRARRRHLRRLGRHGSLLDMSGSKGRSVTRWSAMRSGADELAASRSARRRHRRCRSTRAGGRARWRRGARTAVGAALRRSTASGRARALELASRGLATRRRTLRFIDASASLATKTATRARPRPERATAADLRPRPRPSSSTAPLPSVTGAVPAGCAQTSRARRVSSGATTASNWRSADDRRRSGGLQCIQRMTTGVV